ncbi:hypothetical protein D9619_007687 [Psilocybe cf. subviscida]|uniref:Nephrocystin 3-like N-terminal domain-containing protein n=1 Tax=Psilocybe cf. subviscida TaxID=2480587 RepID=A0A8H5AUN6_9AGAR|nr:hypothetical protein D9619_007687 [Psilocybe cf. subviscida]
MSVFPGATNTTINNGNFTAIANIGVKNDVVALLHSHSATAGLLDAKERFDAPKCDEGTRTSMILGMRNFVQDGHAASSSALYWLHGPAGVGKSALAQSLSLSLKTEGDHAASFFFSRTSPGRSNGNQLVVTLAYQLSTSFPALRRFMSKVVKENPAIFTASNAVQMQSLIIDPINKWQKKYNQSIRRWVHRVFNINAKLHPRLILVDGLDECNDPDVQKDLIFCIGLVVRQLSIPMRFVIASRQESHILATFELDPVFQGLDGVRVTKKNLGDDEDADKQITTFILKEFAEIRRVHPIREFLPEQWPRADQIEQLVFKSSKGFIYPATVIRYIKMPNTRPDECLERILGLSAIPTFDKPYEPLDRLYRHIFESVPEINKTSILEIFHFLVLPSTWDGAIYPRRIEKHFGYKRGHVQHVLRDLLCLVAFTNNGCIKVLHASLPDFLLDQSRSGPLCINVGDAHATTAASHLLDIIHGDELPTFQVNLLEHMMQANLSNTLISHRIRQMDLLPRYTRLCWRWLNVAKPEFAPNATWSQYADSQYLPDDWPSLSDVKFPSFRELYTPRIGIEYEWQSLPEADMKGIAYMVVYLLIIAIRHGEQRYIEAQIANIKAYVLQLCPFVASVRLMYEELIPAMILLFRKWNSTVYDEYINCIFGFEVAPSQHQIREDIFELYFLMMVPFCGADITRVPQGKERTRNSEAIQPIAWADIVRNIGDDGDVDKLIMAFLLKEFAEIRRVHPIRGFPLQQWPLPNQIEQLVSMSSKRFIYPATVIQCIKMRNKRPDKCLQRILSLSPLPPIDKPYEPFDALYRYVFESVPESNKVAVHNIFHFLVLLDTSDGSIAPCTIERHFDYEPGHVQRVLNDLLCLVTFTRDGCIKVLHASLPDFLLDRSRSGPLCIDVGNAHAAFAASYLLDFSHGDDLPDRNSREGVADFLEDLIQANLSDSNTLVYRRILQMDLVSRYRKACDSRLRLKDFRRSNILLPAAVDAKIELYEIIEGIAFMTAYLLVLVIRRGPQSYIMRQVEGIKVHVLKIYPSAKSVRTVHEELIPVM